MTDLDADPVYARRLLITVIVGVLAFSSSMTVVSAVLSEIADDLNSTAGTVSWAVTGLFLTMAIGTPVMGRIGDAVGRRMMFLIGTAVLAVATAACGLAWNAGSFIAFRMIGGLGIAMTMPNGMAMVIDAHPPERRAVALGWFQMVMTGAPVLALIVGAWLTELFGWRSVFALLTPIAVIGFIGGLRNVKDVGPSRAGVTVDWYGASLLGVATLTFLLGLERIKASSVADPLALVLFLCCAGGLIAFIAVERRVSQPLLRLDYFSKRNFTGPLIAQPLAQFAYMGGFVMTPLLLKSVFGLGVAASSWILLFRPAVFSVASPIGGRLATRLGTRTMILGGAVVMVLSMVVFAIGSASQLLWLIVAGLVLSGAAAGLASPSYGTAVAAAVEPADLGVANGMNSTLMNIGMLTGIQTMFVVIQDRRTPAAFGQVFLVGAAVAAVGIVGGLIMTGGRVQRTARPAVADGLDGAV